MEFSDFFQTATGNDPYPYQARLGAGDPPDVLRVDTGCGKTEAAILSWLWRRRIAAPSATPRWLIYCLPMRSLVDQTFDRVEKWREALALGPLQLGVHRVMGGVDWDDRDWRLAPERDAIFIGTVDMLLSRALNRGFADSRWLWPSSFGAFNTGTQWVFDEVQLMDAAVPTGRQLQAFRDTMGTAQHTRTMWMSATVDFDSLRTIDAPDVGRVVSTDEADLAHPAIRTRLEAARTVESVGDVPDDAHVARVAVENHRPGTLTLVVVNTVKRAQNAYRKLERIAPAAETALVHSRYRSLDRDVAQRRVTAPLGSEGRIVVATQVVEAGVDLSAATLITDLAPWPSIVQRAGRCNRTGTESDARMLWMRPKSNLPYEDDDVYAAEEVLSGIEGPVTPSMLSAIHVDTPYRPLPILRRRDLVELFDTLPDLGGNDIDVGRFIRDSDERDVSVLWRSIEDGALADDRGPLADELCRVPIGELRKFVKKHDNPAYLLDPSDQVRWRRCHSAELRPNMVVAMDASVGGYGAEFGFDSSSKAAVEPVEIAEASIDDIGVEDDPASTSFSSAHWVPLPEHLADVEREAGVLLDRFGDLDLAAGAIDAVPLAGRFHDLGKAHPAFQAALAETATEVTPRPDSGEAFAKGGDGRLRHNRRFFRHELASVLMLLGPASDLLADLEEPDLVAYLVASHHGRVRLGVRRLDDERPPADRPEADVALGVVDGDELPSVNLGDQVAVGGALSLSDMGVGAGTGPIPSYTARMLDLRDREDLGPFRLAFMEMIVRLADWRASRPPQRATP
ncbi:MAG: CRISPR-associated endonuclease Cas3'' [Acidimicrobiales bacterium]